VLFSNHNLFLLSGDPFANHGDPGFLSQIFSSTKSNTHGQIVLRDGITATEISNCQRYMSSKTFSTLRSYR